MPQKKNAPIPTHNPKGQKQQKSPRPQRNQHQNPRQKQPRSNKQGGIHSRRLAIPIGLPLIHGQNHCAVNHYPRRTRRLRFPRSSRPAPTAVCFSPSAAATTAPCATFFHTPGATFHTPPSQLQLPALPPFTKSESYPSLHAMPPPLCLVPRQCYTARNAAQSG